VRIIEGAMWLFPPYRLDVINQRLWRNDESIPLMPKPFAVLQYLVERTGHLVTQDELLAAIWPDTHVQADVLRRYILEVRRALGDHAETPRFIETLPKRGYRFIVPATESVAADTEVSNGSEATLVGRESAVAELENHFQTAVHGQRQLIFVSGEAGIGKTSLLQAFARKIGSNPGVHVAVGQCAEGFGGKEPYYPILEAVGRLIRGPARTLVANALAQAAPTWMVQFPALMRTGDQGDLQRNILGATRERMVREFCEALEMMAQEVVLVLIFEDLHWIDNPSLDVLSTIARRSERARLVLVGTLRPVDLLISESPSRESDRICCPIASLGS
jgi:DNA-binding winged helix-turn-helix (wHTH) protein